MVIEVLHLVELGGADGAHVGGPLLAAGLGGHAHSRPHAGTHAGPSAHRHGQGHHSGPGLGHRHGDGDGDGAGGAGGGRQRRDAAVCAVQGHVPLQQRLVRELLLADVALVGLLAAVQPHVDVERALLGEALVADAALVGSHARVRHHVFDQVILQGEGAPADAALVRLLTCSRVIGGEGGQGRREGGRETHFQDVTVTFTNVKEPAEHHWRHRTVTALSCEETMRYYPKLYHTLSHDSCNTVFVSQFKSKL